MIDGRFAAIGPSEDEVRGGIARHGGKSKAAIGWRDLGGKSFSVGIGGATAHPAELVLIAVRRKAEVTIARGESGGRKVGYTNVLRNEQRLSTWQGGKASLVIASGKLREPGADADALVLREPDGGTVLAARWVYR